jgi:predicted ATPase
VALPGPRRRKRPVRAHAHVSTIRLRNFRCYRDSGEIELRPLTLILGPNNVGKSTILNSVLLLKQSVDVDTPRETVITAGPMVDLGGFADILYRGAPKSDQTFSIEFSVRHVGETLFSEFGDGRRNPPKSEETVGFVHRFGYNEGANQIRTRSIEFWRNGKPEFRFRARGLHLTLLEADRSTKKGVDVHLFGVVPFVHASGRGLRSEPAQAKEYADLSSRVMAHTWGWVDFFRSLVFLAPLRVSIPRYALQGSTSSGNPAANPAVLLEELRNRVRAGPKGQPLLEMVEKWAKSRLNMLRGLKLESVGETGTVYALLVDETKGFRGINVASMGEGVSQILPILGSLLGSNRGTCTLVEQPELHLHPDLQARLADLFVEQVADREMQVIVETHSEHILSRVRRRVAEGDLLPDQVSVLYVDRPGKESRVRRLPIMGDGSMPDWPEGFFEEGLTEAFKIATAKKPRRPS